MFLLKQPHTLLRHLKMQRVLVSLSLELRERRHHIFQIVDAYLTTTIKSAICTTGHMPISQSQSADTHLSANPACSCANRLKSVINRSIASFMCRCRTETQIGSSSVSSASRFSVPPTVFVYLYLLVSSCTVVTTAIAMYVAHLYFTPSSTFSRSFTIA